MDVLAKMFKKNDKKEKSNNSDLMDQKSSQYSDDQNTEIDKFSFQDFTNPLELHKQFERQMQQIFEAMGEFENKGLPFDNDFFKSNFENELFKKFQKNKNNGVDSDLDGKILSDQLHSIIQRFANNNDSYILKENSSTIESVPAPMGKMLPSNDHTFSVHRQKKTKMSDEDMFMARIHGTLNNPVGTEQRRRVSSPINSRFRSDLISPLHPLPRNDNTDIFNTPNNGRKMFSQQIITKIVRKPDGTYETTKIVQDSHGKKTTTVTRNRNGQNETVTYFNEDDKRIINENHTNNIDSANFVERNIFVSKEGYALPLNIC